MISSQTLRIEESAIGAGSWETPRRGRHRDADATMNSNQTVFKAGKDLTVDEAKARFREGQDSLRCLLDNHDEICNTGGGDDKSRRDDDREGHGRDDDHHR